MNIQIPENQLLSVAKPAQYLGGERGSIIKNEADVDLHFLLAFPDTYEVGMSHIGMQILYDLINRDARAWAERAYVPQADMEKLQRSHGAPLCSLESKRRVRDFDVVGFSLQYELCATGILTILDLGGVPLLSADRAEDDPIVIGGGPVTYHPEPFADFFDCFLVGDGEELVVDFIAAVRAGRQAKTDSDRPLNRRERLERLAEIPGVYVPSLFEPQYGADGNFAGLRPLKAGYESVRRRIISTLVGAPYPTSPVVPNIQAVHDRLSVEVMRGCVRGCRFCQAGYLYRPQRERSPEDVIKIVGDSLKNTGYEELSLLSLSTADYCSILPLLSSLKERFAQNDQLAISFPSTRVDALKPELLQEVQPVRRSGFTIAPEAGTQRLRDVINKGVTDDQLMQTCENVFRLGWNSVKMYFMIGLPTETDEDVLGIAETGIRVKQIAKRFGARNSVTVSVSTLCPKPHTPFQWAEQLSESETRRKHDLIGGILRRHKIVFRYHDAFSTYLEGVFARSDRRLSRVFLRAYELGCRLEGWTEKVQAGMWRQALADCGIDGDHCLRQRDESAALPWDHISCDIPKSYFLKEWQRATAVRTTPDCLTQSCSSCGACDYDATRNDLFDRSRTEERMGLVQPRWLKVIAQREAGVAESQIELEADLTPSKWPAPSSSNREDNQERAGKYELREYLRTEPAPAEPTPDAARATLPARQRIRLTYTKLGTQRFTAHLEQASIFFRALRRIDAPITFSRGFNPRPKMIFGPPLQLGIASTCEMIDLYLTAELPLDALHRIFVEELNTVLPPGLAVQSLDIIPLKSAAIQALTREFVYRIALPADAWTQPEMAARLADWRTLTLLRVRKTGATESSLQDFVSAVTRDADALIVTVPFDNCAPGAKPSEIAEVLSGRPWSEVMIEKIESRLESLSVPSDIAFLTPPPAEMHARQR